MGAAPGCASDDAMMDSDAEANTESADGTDESGDTGDTGDTLAPESCEDIAALFQTLGSANPDLPEPLVSATCSDGMVTVMSNSIPDFPYIASSPGVPSEIDMTYTFPASPTVADTTTEVPIVGAIGVAVNGIPIFGPTEGPGGDVNARPGGFTECGGHNGPSTYHYHLFMVTGSDRCRFSESDGRVVYGYALDGYPIYGGFDYASSYELTDESLFDSDTWAAHTYVEGLGDLDECNGLTDANGNYGYYATETFPYLMGCFRGELQ
ncbi:MAG: YHYH protein [Deltaproteobacteria bacterium]|nr:YHYH protein [Deltaproteobacteria bacterium]